MTQVLTPGTLTDTQLLDAKSPSYLFSFFPAQDSWGLLFGELLTAQLFSATIAPEALRALEGELARFFPDEVLVPAGNAYNFCPPLFKRMGYQATPVFFDQDDMALRSSFDGWVQGQFGDATAARIHGSAATMQSLVHFYAYLQRTQSSALEQFKTFNLYDVEDFLMIDAATQRNLEIVKNSTDGTSKHTLFSVMDRAKTPMGSRMIKKWLMRPLVKLEAIDRRQEVVAQFVDRTDLLEELAAALRTVGDIERVVGRIALSRATTHDYAMLGAALVAIESVIAALARMPVGAMTGAIVASLQNFSPLQRLLASAINDDSSSDWIIRAGFDHELDQLRDLVHHSKQRLLRFEQEQQKETGIGSLKVRHNGVHGYYIEVTKTHKDRVPEQYVRTQTLVGKERFTMPALQQLQHEITQARMRVDEVERAVFERVKNEVRDYLHPLRKAAHALAHLDALSGFATTASEFGYVRPTFNAEREVHIAQGRHPVIEQHAAGSFIANDTQLDDEQSFWIVTGPNMGGKSTYLRQVAQIALLAHCGSFVPAQSANIALLDRIFSRIGAGDSLAEGRSTFLVEMEETASICSQATERSLVILDEVGRGTSTNDGRAIAQAVVEYLHTEVRARCLFATHYHELTQLEKDHPGIVSYHTASKRSGDGILFLYQMIRGVADGSFGVEVARLAQLPDVVIERARMLAGTADESALVTGVQQMPPMDQSDGGARREMIDLREQLAAAQQRIKVLDDLDYDDLSPRKAFDLVWRLRDQGNQS